MQIRCAVAHRMKAHYRRQLSVPLAMGLAVCQGAAWGQVVPANSPVTGPDQELVRQRERERALRKQLEPTPDSLLQKPAPGGLSVVPHEEQPCFPIHQIVLEGERSAQFHWALAAANAPNDSALNRCLGAVGINAVMSRIQNAIIARGFVTTRVLASAQDLTTGVLRLSLIPGTLGQIRFAEGMPPEAKAWNAIPVHSGDLLNLRAIEQGLENFRRVPTVDATIEIVPSTGDQVRPGQSDLIVHWAQSRRMRWNVSLDDSGSRATGRLQAGLTWSLDNALHVNDLFYLNLNHDAESHRPSGTHGLTVHYSVPFGNWLLSMTVSHYTFAQLVFGTTPTYRYSGKSQTGELRITRMLRRTAHSKTAMYARGWERGGRNYLADTAIPIQHRRMAGWEAGLTHRQFFGTATLDASARIHRGTGALGALHAPEERFGEGTSRPQFYAADAQLSIPFHWGKQRLSYVGEWRAQWNHTPLVPQDRFAIGGRYTVRGFDGEVILMGEHGWLLRNDLGLELGSRQHAYVAVDTGHVSGPSTRLQSGGQLTGMVLGLRGGFHELSWDVFVGTALRQPRGLDSAYTTTGFLLSASF